MITKIFFRRGVFCLLLLGGMGAPVLGQTLVVGDNTPGNTTNISSGTNRYLFTVVGNQAGASNNRLNVFNSGTVLTNSGNLTVGNSGSSNSLVISNAGRVVNRLGFIGANINSSNNSVLVTGTNSAWTNSSDLYVGNNGSSNSLVISNGGGVVNANGIIGNISSNNSVLVAGTNSAWTNTGDLYVGLNGRSNSLVISNGGSVVSQVGLIGVNTTSSNNIVTVTGTKSAWTNTTDLLVGNNGSSNSLVITSGGSVIDQIGYIGFTTTSSNNSVVVTGTNSAWTNTDTSYIGYDGSSNSLVISSGASVVNSDGYIGNTRVCPNTGAPIPPRRSKQKTPRRKNILVIN